MNNVIIWFKFIVIQKLGLKSINFKRLENIVSNNFKTKMLKFGIRRLCLILNTIIHSLIDKNWILLNFK